MIITISGLAGSGTTTAARLLSEKLKIPYISAGDIFREMAAESKQDILGFSKFAENNIEVDQEIDRRQAELARKADHLIVEGRLSAYFVEADLKVWMIAPFDVRAARISKRESKALDDIIEEVKEREQSETRRYLDIHQIDINDLEIYDLILNTNSFQAEKIAEIIVKVQEVI